MVRGDRGRGMKTPRISNPAPVSDEAFVVSLSENTPLGDLDGAATPATDRYSNSDAGRAARAADFQASARTIREGGSNLRLFSKPIIREGQDSATLGTDKKSVPVPSRRLIKEQSLSSEIEENILDAYDSPIYHFRLFMMPTEASKAGAIGAYDQFEQIVLAQTGASTIGIDEVSIETVGAITKEAGTGTATKFSFVLKQPFGVSLLDIIESSAGRLGIENWSKSPFYLELSFRARDRDTGAPVKDGPLSQQVWVWPILFTKTGISVTTSGSVYNIEAVHTGDRAYTNEVSDLDQVESIPAGTVGAFFEELAARLNRHKNDVEEDGTSRKDATAQDEYQFYIDEKISKESILLDNSDSKPGRTGVFDIDDDKKTLSFHLNTSIDRIVDSIMAMTPFFQKAATGEKEPDKSEEPADDKTQVQFTKLWRVLTDSRIKGYDAERNDYSHVYRYLIIPYDSPTTRNPAKEQTEVGPKEIISVMRERGTLKKSYNYIFTGMNDQVLDFDINFNFNWYAALPFNSGLHASGDSIGLPQSSAITDPSENPEQVKQTINASTIKWKAIPREDIATSNPLGIGFSSSSELADRFGGPRPEEGPPFGSTDAQFSEFARTLPRDDGGIIQTGGLNNLQRISPTADNINQLTGRPAQEITSLTSKVKKTPTGVTPRPPSGVLPGFPRLAEDLFEDEQAGRIPKIPVSYRKQSHGKENIVNAEGEQNRGKILLSALFEQARSPAAADLLSIELKVKGDPYWLEPGPVGKRKKPLSTLERELQRRGMSLSPVDGTVISVPEGGPEVTDEGEVISSVSTTTDQTFFVFRMFTPQTFDNDTGLMNVPSTNNILNGLYAVSHTKHDFSGGLFTQTLKSIRMLDLDVTAELIESLNQGESLNRTTESRTAGATATSTEQPPAREEDGSTANTDNPSPLSIPRAAGEGRPGGTTIIGPNGGGGGF